MENLVEKSKFIFEEKIAGQVYKELDEAIKSLLDSAGNDLWAELKNPSNSYSRSGSEILENRDNILEALKRFKTAIEKPLTLINEYKSNQL